MKRLEGLVCALVAGLLLVGCAQSSDGETASAPTSSTSPTRPSAEDVHVGEVVPSPAAADVDAALDAAERAVELFARPGLEQDVWLRELMPRLSQAGAPLFATIQPSSISATSRTGAGALLPDATGYVVLVSVPTDAGDMVVSLSRTAPGAPWLVDRIRPDQG